MSYEKGNIVFSPDLTGGQDYKTNEDPLSPTIELAKKGLAIVQDLRTHLPEQLRGKQFATAPATLRCFVGTSSLVTLDAQPRDTTKTINDMNLTTQNIQQIQDALGDSEDFLVLTYTPNKAVKQVSLVNIPAFKRLTMLHPAIFPPEAQTESKKWLTDHMKTWIHQGNRESTIQYGLLSGFPIQAVLAYQDDPYLVAYRKFIQGIGVQFQKHPDPSYVITLQQFFEKYATIDSPPAAYLTGAHQLLATTELLTAASLIPEEQAVLQKPGGIRYIQSMAVGGFFTAKADIDSVNTYIQQAEAIFQQSGALSLSKR